MKIKKMELIDHGFRDEIGTEQPEYFLFIVSFSESPYQINLEDEVRKFLKEKRITLNSCINDLNDYLDEIREQLKKNDKFEIVEINTKTDFDYGNSGHPWIEIIYMHDVSS